MRIERPRGRWTEQSDSAKEQVISFIVWQASVRRLSQADIIRHLGNELLAALVKQV